MATITPDPNSTQPPASSDQVVFANFRGRPYVRKWPRKAGPPKGSYNQETVRRFVEAQRMAKNAAPEQIIEAMRATKRSGLYPRDLLTKAMLAGFYDIVLDDGQVITRAPLTYEVPVFVGFSLTRAVSFGIPASSPRVVPWDTPLLNPQNLWDPADPGAIVIPNGISVMDFTAVARFPGGGNSFDVLTIATEGFGFNAVELAFASTAETRLFVTTGPIPVSPGQRWVTYVYSTTTQTIPGGQNVIGFRGQVLG